METSERNDNFNWRRGLICLLIGFVGLYHIALLNYWKAKLVATIFLLVRLGFRYFRTGDLEIMTLGIIIALVFNLFLHLYLAKVRVCR